MVDKKIYALISAANEMTSADSLGPAQVKLYGMTCDLIGTGTQRRLQAIKESYRINDPIIRLTVVGDLIGGVPGISNRLDSEALTVLASSDREELWDYLCQSAHIFARYVSRAELRRSLVTAWRKAKGVAKENLEYTLRRQGFGKVFSQWM
jgi:hypothetical protein